MPGRGSDDADAYDVGARALIAGESPYRLTTYLGNPLHQLPGAFVLSAPFVVLGTSALQNLFWLAMLYLVVRRAPGDERIALQLAWLVVGFSPTIMYQVVTGTGYLANTAYVLIGLWWLMRSRHGAIAATAWGVALASRANFLFLMPLAAGWLRRHRGRRAARQSVALTSLTVAALALPFYLHDPGAFGPLEAANRVFRFDALAPHLGLALLVAMGGLAAGLSLLPMDRARLFQYCAAVQALPILAGTVFESLLTGRADVGYSSYGTFFSLFALVALALDPNASTGSALHRGLRRRAGNQPRAADYVVEPRSAHHHRPRAIARSPIAPA